jgi:outer membrane murein-binding lipoprotein Lpp
MPGIGHIADLTDVAALSAVKISSRQSPIAAVVGSLKLDPFRRGVGETLARSQSSLNLMTRSSRAFAMSGEPDSLVLVYLRRIDGKIDRLIDDVQDLKHRVTSLEGQVAGLRSETASIRGDMAAMSLRIDRIETRLDRIERRLDLVPEPAG